ncbi:DUF2949 domain-containing protein [Anthocerotibacter panamensis]|uniref:DUF2949 domain-containing protein n=1 Tax=Anthocerotibacter panamensis TaxID=2857077 RepID=UPI001C407E6D|nr:DUF2949 domain-containing protein [Anthocerotibacter panamensis]
MYPTARNLKTSELLKFVTHSQLSLALKVQMREHGPIEIILWQLGFITLEQLAVIL